MTDNLTDRERQVLAQVADGLSYIEIGAELHLSPDTVKAHLLRARRKLRARNRAHAVAIAFRTGILPADTTKDGR